MASMRRAQLGAFLAVSMAVLGTVTWPEQPMLAVTGTLLCCFAVEVCVRWAIRLRKRDLP